MNYDDLTDEQKNKLVGCTTPEEILALAKDEGVELDDKDLEKVAGGIDWDDSMPCPFCGAKPTGIHGTNGARFCYKCNKEGF